MIHFDFMTPTCSPGPEKAMAPFSGNVSSGLAMYEAARVRGFIRGLAPLCCASASIKPKCITSPFVGTGNAVATLFL